MPVTKRVVESFNLFSNAVLEINISCTRPKDPKTNEKQPSISITLHRTKTRPEIAVLLQTYGQIVASVPRIEPK